MTSHQNTAKTANKASDYETDQATAGDRANAGPKSTASRSAGDTACRRDAIEFALSLHRGKDKPAAEIVREAAVIEAYIHEGTVPEPTPAPAPTGGVNVPPG